MTYSMGGGVVGVGKGVWVAVRVGVGVAEGVKVGVMVGVGKIIRMALGRGTVPEAMSTSHTPKAATSARAARINGLG
jgi:hypothetical protein